MHRIKLISLMLVFAITIVVSSMAVSADNDITQAWPVEVKCIPDPVLPPENWTYSGTILMSGYAGIHGIRADWEIPHVLAFFRKDANGDYPLYGGQLSPDMHWYAAPVGEQWKEVPFNYYWDVRKVRLYDLSGNDADITLDLADYLDLYQYVPTAWSYLPIEWSTVDTLHIGSLLLDPFSNKVEEVSFNSVAYANTSDKRFFSPDFKRLYVHRNVGYQKGGLIRLDNLSLGYLDIGEVTGLYWQHDSSGFIAEIGKVLSDTRLTLYDRDGKLLNLILDLGKGGVYFQRGTSGRNDLGWSPDNRQFAFTFIHAFQYPDQNRLQIVNLKEQTITDTCLRPISQPVWSPDGKMLAYLALARENLKIIVVDLEDWKAYDIGRHSGRNTSTLTGSPEMVGWRA